MSKPVVQPTAATIADAVKSQVRAYGQTTAMIKAVYASEGMACGPTLAEVVGILLDPKRSKGGDSDRVTFYETFRKTAQRAIGDDCLLPPVFLLDKASNACRVVLLGKAATIAEIKAVGLPTREENKALMAAMLRDNPAAPAPLAEVADKSATEPDDKGADEPSADADAEPSAPALSAFDQLVATLSSMDASQVRELVGAIGAANPAQLVTLGDAVNTALKAANKQVQATSQVQAYKSAGAAPSKMGAPIAELTDSAPAMVIPAPNVVQAALANAKPLRKGKRAAA